ncbi:MAG TPA: hypothetical protein VFL91_15280 [Thermomicrobiales bacterium]|nr:hypothetical protein [Thermomicrobiales bacterium]
MPRTDSRAEDDPRAEADETAAEARAAEETPEAAAAAFDERGHLDVVDHADRNGVVYGTVLPARVVEAPRDPDDDGGRARRAAMLRELRAGMDEEDQPVAHPTLRHPSAFRGLSRQQVEAISGPGHDREVALALWEEANEAHLDEHGRPPEEGAAAAEGASDDEGEAKE